MISMIVLPRDKFYIVGLHRNKKDSRRDALYFVSLTCSVLLGIFGIIVLPLSSTTMPRAKREVWNLVTVSHNYVRCIRWFTYLVNGTRNEKEYGLIHTYKDLIEDFEEI